MPEPAARGYAVVAPKLARVGEEVQHGDVWERSEPSSSNRCPITIAGPVAHYHLEQLPSHHRRAMDNGITIEDLGEGAASVRELRAILEFGAGTLDGAQPGRAEDEEGVA